MKLLFIHHSGILGGAGVSLRNIITGLLPDNDITLFLPTDPPDMWTSFKELQKSAWGYKLTLKTYGRRIGALTYYSGGDQVLSLRFGYRFFLILFQYLFWYKAVKDEEADIVVTNSMILSWLVLISRSRKTSCVCFVRETMRGKNSSLINKMIRWLLSRHSLVFFLSDYDRKQFALGTTRTAVVHNFVDSAQYDVMLPPDQELEKLGLNNGNLHVLYVGGVSYMKGFDIAVNAVLACGKGVDLLVAGNNFEETYRDSSGHAVRYAQKMQRHIISKDQLSQIHMLGRQKNMSAYYAACDVVLFPMRSSHQARPAFEAGYFSHPIIISDFDNIKEFVKDSFNGFLVTPSVESVKEKLLFFKQKPQMLVQMGKANHSVCLRMHDQRKSIDKVKKYLRLLVKQ